VILSSRSSPLAPRDARDPAYPWILPSFGQLKYASPLSSTPIFEQASPASSLFAAVIVMVMVMVMIMLPWSLPEQQQLRII